MGYKKWVWLIGLMVLLGCESPAGPAATATVVKWREFKNEQFTIDYPAAWKVAHNGSETTFAAVEHNLAVTVQTSDVTSGVPPSVDRLLQPFAAEGFVFEPLAKPPTDYPNATWLEAPLLNDDLAETLLVLIIFHEDKVAMIQAKASEGQRPLIEQMLGSFRFLVAGTL